MADATVEVKKYVTDALFQEPLIYWDGRHAVCLHFHMVAKHTCATTVPCEWIFSNNLNILMFF